MSLAWVGAATAGLSSQHNVNSAAPARNGSTTERRMISRIRMPLDTIQV